jgi:hypothetical protein
MADVPVEFLTENLPITSLYRYWYANSLDEAVFPLLTEQGKKIHGGMEVTLHTYF